MATTDNRTFAEVTVDSPVHTTGLVTSTDAAPPGAPSEAGSLMREIGRSYVAAVRFYRTQMGKDLHGADEAVRDLTAYDTDQLPDAPADQIGWMGLGRLIDHDPDLGLSVWERIKNEARDELDSGHRAAVVMEWEGRPWDRARYLAVREAFRDEWQPTGGIQDALIDVMAQAHTAYLIEMLNVQVRTQIESKRTAQHIATSYQREAPRLSDVEATEQSAAMADRYNKLFLRTLRALRDLRRHAPAVVVQNTGGGQVNIAQQQVNTVAPAASPVRPASTGDDEPATSGAKDER